MKTKPTLLCLLLFLANMQSFAQERIINGTVTSEPGGVSLPGVNVVVKGTSKGTITDFDGNYSISATNSDILVFSFLGFETNELSVGTQNTINVIMTESASALGEVVLIGYGSQKKADLTGSITTIKAEDITRTPSGAAMQSLQGKVAGLQVVSSGAPGTAPTIRVRGLGSYTGGGASDPLYVVDGVFYDDINFLNSEEIETISVLKDASASAIYGVRAANGVVLIQTKSGKKNQKPQITYNGYQGMQIAQNVVKLSNAEQFSTLARESGSAAEASFIENAMQRYGRSRINPNIPAVNTDWYDLILRDALIQNHSLGVTGGSESVTYSLGLSQFEQEGILRMKNDYERFNIRSKINVDISDRLKAGVSTLLSNATRYRPEDGAFSSAYFAVPIMPVLDPSKTDAYPRPYANAQDLEYRGPQNPFPLMENTENRNKIRNTLMTFDLSYQLMPDKLTFKTAYSHNFETLETREVRLPYFFGTGDAFRKNAELIKRNETFSEQTWDNTLTYNDDFGKHNLTVLAGTSFRDRSWEQLEIKGVNFPNGPGIGDESYFLDLSETIDVTEGDNGDRATGDNGVRQYFFSYFGRVAYNFDDRYLLYGTFRADGTSKYQEKWGYFPTVGIGWVISEESFMKDNGVLDFLKLRASWGELGNANVNASTGGITSSEVTAAFGDVRYPGLVTSSDFEALKWEVTAETNVGISARLFESQLSVEADYFTRETRDAIIPVSRLLVQGSTRQNVGIIENSGFEFDLNWNKRVSEDFSYSIGANFSTLKNEILDLAGQENLTTGGDVAQRSVVGGSINSFYGLEVAGVYQTPEEIQADPAAQKAIADGDSNMPPAVQPGDFRFVDHNGDGIIDAQDRVDLGSFLPSYTFGFNFGLNYKAWDFSLNVIGQGGNVIANMKRFAIRQTPDPNIDRDFAINRWHGPGTSNDYPSARGIRNPWSNQFLNSFFVEKGDFVRLQNVTLGYTLPQFQGKFNPDIRLYVTAERPLTFFEYNGFTPEVSDGRDNQTYPIPGVYTFGVNIKI